jgi:cation transport ATPase
MALWSPAGGPVLYGGLRAFLFRTPSADLLISAALVVAYVSSLMAILSSAPRLHYFHAVVMILVFVNLGRYLEARAGGRVSKAVDALFSRLPPSVTLLTAGRPQEAALETVARGDILSVAADEFIPVDGRILAGQATVDESVLFGGASAVVRRSGDPVLAGTFLLDGSLTVEASASATQSSWGQVMTTVYKAQSTRTRLQSVADGLAQWLVVVVLGVALTTAVAWGLWGQNGSIGVARAVAVLAIACPCAFGLATPAALYIASARAALHGIVVQDASAFEQLGLPHTRWEARAGSAAGSVIIRTPVDQSAVKPSSDLPGERLDPAADAVALARRTRRIMLQNLLWALSYNVAAIPLAAVGAIPAWVAPGFMMSSRLVAVFNALRLRRVSWTGGASLR